MNTEKPAAHPAGRRHVWHWREAFGIGARVMGPGSLATGAWGLVTGIAMVKTGLSTADALGMTLLVFAGSAQLAALPLIAAGAPIWVVLLTATVVNLRFVIYSAAMAPYFRGLPLGRRLGLGYLTSDLGVMLFLPRYEHRPDSPERVAFFMGGASMNWLAWQLASVTGILLASIIPTEWQLQFAGTLALVALVMPMLQNRPTLACALASGITAVGLHALPLKLGLLCAVIAGMAAAMWVDSLSKDADASGPTGPSAGAAASPSSSPSSSPSAGGSVALDDGGSVAAAQAIGACSTGVDGSPQAPAAPGETSR